jgi:hypothetical protein
MGSALELTFLRRVAGPVLGHHEEPAMRRRDGR